MPLRRPPQKKLSPAQQKWFWENYDAGKIKEKRERILDKTFGADSRKPVYASPSMMGTVREFADKEHMAEHIGRVSRINRLGSQTKFKTFEFQPTQILAVDRKNLRTLERVYRAPNAARILGSYKWNRFNSPFGRVFLKRMQKKEAGFKGMKMAVQKTLLEIYEKISSKIGFDDSETNILVLDYDPETKKPLIAIVDHGLSI